MQLIQELSIHKKLKKLKKNAQHFQRAMFNFNQILIIGLCFSNRNSQKRKRKYIWMFQILL